MRVKMVVFIALVIGAVVAASLLVKDGAFNSSQKATVTQACPTCHGNVPEYEVASPVHNRHASFDCSRCHGVDGGLNVSDRAHTGLEWLGVTGAFLVLTGIIANTVTVVRKGRTK